MDWILLTGAFCVLLWVEPEHEPVDLKLICGARVGAVISYPDLRLLHKLFLNKNFTLE